MLKPKMKLHNICVPQVKETRAQLFVFIYMGKLSQIKSKYCLKISKYFIISGRRKH